MPSTNYYETQFQCQLCHFANVYFRILTGIYSPDDDNWTVIAIIIIIMVIQRIQPQREEFGDKRVHKDR